MDSQAIHSELDHQIDSLAAAQFQAATICISLAYYKAVVYRIDADPQTQHRQGRLPTHYRGAQFLVFERPGVLRVTPGHGQIEKRSRAWREWRLANLPSEQMRTCERRQGALIVNRELRTALAELAGGEFPTTMDAWRRVGHCLGVGIEEIEGVRRPFVNLTAGFVGLPSGLPWITRQAALIHELGELAMQQDCWPEYHYPPELGNHHEIAKITEIEYAREHGYEMAPGGGYRQI